MRVDSVVCVIDVYLKNLMNESPAGQSNVTSQLVRPLQQLGAHSGNGAIDDGGATKSKGTSEAEDGDRGAEQEEEGGHEPDSSRHGHGRCSATVVLQKASTTKATPMLLDAFDGAQDWSSQKARVQPEIRELHGFGVDEKSESEGLDKDLLAASTKLLTGMCKVWLASFLSLVPLPIGQGGHSIPVSKDSGLPCRDTAGNCPIVKWLAFFLCLDIDVFLFQGIVGCKEGEGRSKPGQKSSMSAPG